MFGKYPSLFLLSFIVPSIAFAAIFMVPAWLLFGIAVIATAAGVACLHFTRPTIATFCFGLAVGLLAASHFSVLYVSTGPTHVANVVTEGKRAHIFGVVSDWPEIKYDLTEVTISLDSLGDIEGNNRPVTGGILLKVTDTTTALQRGDRIEFFGRIYPLNWREANDRLDYRRRLHLRGIFATVYLPTLLDVRIDRRYPWGIFGVADRVHDAVVGAIKSDLPERTAALAAGFLIGETRGIPVDVFQRFRDSGTLHVLAVSGGNVALVCLFVILLLRPFGAIGRTRAMILLVVVMLFALICYAEPSVVRASIMAVLVIIARLLQRKVDLHNIIALTAVLVLLYDPAQLFDVGAQLSFASAWGLILFMPHVAALFEPVQHRWWYRFLLFPVLVSLVAQLCSTPLIAYYFGKVPVLSVLANLVVVPLAAAATLGTLAMLTAHLVYPLLGVLVGSVLHPVLLLLLGFVKFFGGSGVPQVDLSGVFARSGGWVEIICAYIVIALLAWSLRFKPARRLLLGTIVVLANLLLVRLTVEAASSDSERCIAVSVPGGVAVVFVTPGQRPDMVITGLVEKPYEMDSRILGPLVKNQRVDSIGRLFVLSTDYGATDDLIRFALSARVETLFVDARMGGAIRELAGRLDSAHKIILREFGGDAVLSGEAILADRRGVCFSSGREKVLVSRSLLDTSGAAVRPSTWIYGRTWRPKPDDWLAYRRAGVGRIVCAKIEQALPEDEIMRAADMILPDQIIDLSATTQVTLPLASRQACTFDSSSLSNYR